MNGETGTALYKICSLQAVRQERKKLRLDVYEQCKL